MLYVAGREPGTKQYRFLRFRRTISEDPRENEFARIIYEDNERYKEKVKTSIGSGRLCPSSVPLAEHFGDAR